jgi:Fe-S-cluster containining protein
MTPLEQQQIRVRHGVRLPLLGAFGATGERCPALSDAGRCTVYDDRPFVCRIYGVTEMLACPYGCEPDGGWWPERDAQLTMARIEEISGNPRRAAALRRAAGR